MKNLRQSRHLTNQFKFRQFFYIICGGGSVMDISLASSICGGTGVQLQFTSSFGISLASPEKKNLYKTNVTVSKTKFILPNSTH